MREYVKEGGRGVCVSVCVSVCVREKVSERRYQRVYQRGCVSERMKYADDAIKRLMRHLPNNSTYRRHTPLDCRWWNRC